MMDQPYYSLGQDEPSSGVLANMPTILWQRRWYLLVPAALIMIVAISAAFLLPRSYRSSAVVLVESQNLPGGTGSGPVDDVIDRRIAKIRQQILSRPDLVDLIQTNNLYNVASRSDPLSKLVDRMRDATNISAVDADIARGAPGRAGSGSIAFSLTFDYSSPAEAQLVAQTFVDRLLKLDASESQDQAQTNVHYLEDQQAGLQKQVEDLEGQITRITGQNGAALANRAGLGEITVGGGDYETQIASLKRENAQLVARSDETAVNRDPNVTAAEAQLAAARAQYSDNHPDVKLAERRLAAAKSNATSYQANAISGAVQRQLSINNEAISDLIRRRGEAQGRAATAVAAQARGPVVAQQVAQLQAKADQMRTDLGKVTTNLLTARSMAKLTEEQRGERLTLVDPPVTPDTPTSPNRLLLIAGGIFGGLAVGLMLALIVETIRRPIRTVAALTKVTGVPPLAIVPVLSAKIGRGKRLFRWRRRLQSDKGVNL